MDRIIHVPENPEDLFAEPKRIDPAKLLINQPPYRKLRQQMKRELHEVQNHGGHRFLADQERLLRLRRWSRYIQAYEKDIPLDCQFGMWELEYLRCHFFGKRCIHVLMERDDELAHEIRLGLKIVYNKPWPGGNTWACCLFYGAIGWLHRALERPKYPGLNPYMPGKCWHRVTAEGYRIQHWINTGCAEGAHIPADADD